MHQRRRKNIIYLANERNTTNSSNLTDRNDVKSLERRYVSLSQNLFFFLLNGQTLMPSFFDCVEKSSCPASSQQQALKKFGLIFYCNVILK